MSREAIEVQIGAPLRRQGLRLAVAESCTGGLLGHRITNAPGSSDYFLGGVIAYANATKTGLLGVQPETLQRFGAVSSETVIEMARGVRQALQAEIGIAVSGIAGPSGGSAEKPVGLTWIALSTPSFETAWSFIWTGDRLQVKEQTAEQALRLLEEYLSGADTPKQP